MIAHQFFRSLAVTATLCLSPLILGSAHAAAPMAKTMAPGFYRMMLGDFEITALSDGTVNRSEEHTSELQSL